MTQNRPTDFDDLYDQLLAYHLGSLSDAEKRDVEARLNGDPHARQVSEEIKSTLNPLSVYEVPVPAGLKGKIIAAARIPKVSVNSLLEDLTPDVTTPRRNIFARFADFAATAAAVVLISSAVLLSSGYARQQARKAFCAGNLGILGSAITSYANDYHNQLPYVKIPANAMWYDPSNKQPRRVHLFVLVKKNYVSPQFLICPEEKSEQKSMTAKWSSLDDFPRECIVSYSFQNLFGDQNFSPKLRQRRWSQAQQMAVMADRTPLLDKDHLRDNIDADTATSPNHAGLKGQNILSLDGRVTWQNSPHFGPQQDNIWQAGAIRQYVGKEIPTDPTDCFLAP